MELGINSQTLTLLCWSSGMDKVFHSTIYNWQLGIFNFFWYQNIHASPSVTRFVCSYISSMGLKLVKGAQVLLMKYEVHGFKPSPYFIYFKVYSICPVHQGVFTGLNVACDMTFFNSRRLVYIWYIIMWLNPELTYASGLSNNKVL